MFDFLNNTKDRRIKNNIKLVSIHIPKTAGTSFRKSLKEVYGQSKVKRFDLVNHKCHLEETPFSAKKMSSEIEVLHGHMRYDMLIDKFRLSDQVPIITWLRDPVERVISNYFYLSKRLAEELDEEGKGLNILKKMQRSLIEYAHNELNQNRMSKFLSGIELNDITFIGITEHYSEDLQHLAQLLNWKNVDEFKVNITGKKAYSVSEEDKSVIRKLNAKDEELYQKALLIRKKRVADFQNNNK